MKERILLAITASKCHPIVWDKTRTLNRKCRLSRCDPKGISAIEDSMKSVIAGADRFPKGILYSDQI
jgi:hypothetical protein